jgi:hypothetical protein
MAQPRKYLIKKTCCSCGGSGPFGKNRSEADGLQKWCKLCQKEWAAKHYKKNKKKILQRCASYKAAHPEKYNKEYPKRQPPSYRMWIKAQNRAKQSGIPFTIDPSDVSIPVLCPLLGIPLRRGEGVQCRNSPTLDRKNPALGYVKENVWVISYKANAMKQDATLEELELLVQNLRAGMGQ